MKTIMTIITSNGDTIEKDFDGTKDGIEDLCNNIMISDKYFNLEFKDGSFVVVNMSAIAVISLSVIREGDL